MVDKCDIGVMAADRGKVVLFCFTCASHLNVTDENDVMDLRVIKATSKGHKDQVKRNRKFQQEYERANR